MSPAIKIATAVAAVFWTFGCSETVAPEPPPAVTIMAFNVENLFDNVDDPGKDDKTYLPGEVKQLPAHVAECETIAVASWRESCLSLDWSDATIEHKLDVVAAAIRQVNGGRGPDIVALQEIENIAMLERLRTDFLGDSDYLPGILIEGGDVRGIDVAFLTRLPVTGPATLHPLDLPEEFADRAGDTRGLLEVTFQLPDGSHLTGFSAHFPAPFHPTEMRVLAYEHLNRVRQAVAPENNVFAAGDFNTTSSEDTEHGLLDRLVRPYWQISNDYCADCQGSHYYARGDSWSFLDMVLYSPGRGKKTTWKLREDSVHIANQVAGQVTPSGTPLRYDAAGRAGVSDHWPVVVTIEATTEQ